ncbi:MAG: hypothetical protein ABF335_05415 [Alphaproteobacteria bacterium]
MTRSEQTSKYCLKTSKYTKRNLATRFGLATAFAMSMGFGTATASASDQTTAGEKLDQAIRDAGKAAEEIARDSAVLAEELAETAQDAIGDALEAVDRALENMPQYEEPEMDDEGNIIIRRKGDAPSGTDI